MARLLLEKGADPNLSSKHSAASIHIAAVTNNIGIATLLLEAGADPNLPTVPNCRDFAANRSAIKWALLYGFVDLFFLLVHYGVDIREVMSPHDEHTILTLALMSKRLEVIEYLLDKDIWLTTEPRDHSFQACVLFHDMSLIEKFVDHGIEANDPGALAAAVYRKEPHLVEYLLMRVMKDYQHLPTGYGAGGLALAAHL